jgi:predicted HTH transcriptional regulator
MLISNPEKTVEEIAKEVGVTKRTIERTLVSLKKKGLIERIGSNKSGSWLIIL